MFFTYHIVQSNMHDEFFYTNPDDSNKIEYVDYLNIIALGAVMFSLVAVPACSIALISWAVSKYARSKR